MVIKPPPGAGGGSEQSSRVTGRPTLREDDPAPEDGSSGGRGGEWGDGIDTFLGIAIVTKPPPGEGGGSEAGEGVGIGILAERFFISKPPPGVGGGSEQSSRVSGRTPPRADGPAPEDGASGGRGGEWVVGNEGIKN